MFLLEDTPMKNHTPISEQKRLVEKWRDSNLSTAAFAKAMGIPSSTFSGWTRRHPLKETALLESAFIELTSAPKWAPPLDPISIQFAIAGRSPCELRFESLPPPDWLGAVLRGLVAC